MITPLLCLLLPKLVRSVDLQSPVPGDLTLGITLNCPYGLGVCYPEIYDGLSRLPGIESLSEVSDAATWTCKIRMANARLVKPYLLQAYLNSLHAGASLRGVEATLAGRYETDHNRSYLVSRNAWVPLDVLSDTVYWDVNRKRRQTIPDVEKMAYSRLIASAHAGDSLVITGVLRDERDSEIPSLEVRAYRTARVGDIVAEPEPATDELFAEIPVFPDSVESPPVNPKTSAIVVPGAGGGSWSATLNSPRPGIHSHLMPNGAVIYHGADQVIRSFSADGSLGSLAPCRFNLFCSGNALMPDGRLFVAGGNGPYTGAGDASAAIYDSSSDQWLPLPSMGPLRWYPTVVQLPNNHMLVLSGAVSDLRANMPQVWTGTEWITLTGASRSLRRYPNAYLAPDGQVFIAGSDQRCLYLNTNGAGSWESGPLRIFPSRDYGPTVMIQPGKILYIGGGSPPTATTEAIDLNDAHPKWVNMASMTYPRRQCNATILPDGTVLVNGGTYSSLFDDPTKPVYQAELWNPQTNTWSLMAAQKQYRGYHSTAILMPDGRVFTSGGNGSSNIEVFSPPYLFKGPRPSILSAPATVVGGKPFPVFCSEPNAIAKISLIRLSSTTHTMNLEQRFQWLPFVSDKTGVTVTAPTVSPLTPAGYYLLFVLNGQGVPSVARIVQLTPNSEAAQNPLN